jgi:hypothetical protein
MYDCDLKKQRKELDRKGALLSIYPFDHNIKNSYFKLRRIYNKNIKMYEVRYLFLEMGI